MSDGTKGLKELRLELLLTALKRDRRLTITSAWRQVSLYVGGDVRLVKDDLNTLCARNQARKCPGYWRARTDDERRRARLWADYWEVR